MTINNTTIKYSITLLVVLAIVGFVTVSVIRDSKNAEEFKNDLERSAQSEGSEYVSIDGTSVNLSDYKNKVLIINSWASWCPFCVNELPDLDKLAGEYKDKDVVVIAINRKEPKNTIKAFLDSIGNPENILFLLDEQDNFYSSIGGFSMPETVFYDKKGNISFHKRGFMKFEEMKLYIDNALATDNNK